jgi:hypothetical protein
MPSGSTTCLPHQHVMAEIAAVIVDGDARSYIVTWPGLAAGDTGSAVRYSGAADRTVQIFGTFGGATVALQGSLDGTHWSPLTDAQGTAIAATADALEIVTELVRFVRPAVTGGSGVSVTVILLMRTTI